ESMGMGGGALRTIMLRRKIIQLAHTTPVVVGDLGPTNEGHMAVLITHRDKGSEFDEIKIHKECIPI
ncbi:hypothetical protein J6590_063263, partial [Homalodisca vitripennis]